MKQDWGKVFVARRYEPMAPSEAGENYADFVAKGMRPGDLRDREFNKTMHWAANSLARKFLKSDCDSILFIDSDAVFEKRTLELMRTDPEGMEYDVLQAFTVKRGYPPEPMYFVEFPEQPTSLQSRMHGVHFMTQLPLDPHFIYDADAVSLHFTLIKRWIFEQLLEPAGPDHTYWFEYSRDQGEDMTFSVNARKVGARMGMTTKVKVGHAGLMVTGWASMIDYYHLKFAVAAGEPAPSAEHLQQYFIAQQSLAALVAEYTGETPEQVMLKANSGAYMVRDAWRVKEPKSGAEVFAFYSDTPAYLYDLVQWNASPAFQKLLAKLAYVRGERVLEIGGGIGTLTEFLAGRGNTVDYYDVPGVLLDCARWRFARLPFAERIRIIEALEFGVFDRVIATDVIEHLHPEQVALTLEELARALKPGGVLFAHNNWSNDNGLYPQHFDHAAAWCAFLEKWQFRQISEYEWRKPVQVAMTTCQEER